jgi:hypothetical protein
MVERRTNWLSRLRGAGRLTIEFRGPPPEVLTILFGFFLA